MMKQTVTLLAALAAATSMFAGEQNTKTQALNQSSRGYVGLGNAVLIGGAIVEGKDFVIVAIRALGPTLNSVLPKSEVLQNPMLELHGPNGELLATQRSYLENSPADLITLQNANLVPLSANECAMVRRLNPGHYTAIIRGENNTVGIALVEFYKLF